MADTQPRPAEETKALARQHNEALDSNGHLAVIVELFAPLYRDPRDPAGAASAPREVADHLLTQFRAAFPDLRVTTEELIAEENRVATAWTVRGTHQREFCGIPPTGKPVTISGLTLLRLDGARVVEQQTRWDTLGVLRQLGALADPAAAVIA